MCPKKGYSVTSSKMITTFKILKFFLKLKNTIFGYLPRRDKVLCNYNVPAALYWSYAVPHGDR